MSTHGTERRLTTMRSAASQKIPKVFYCWVTRWEIVPPPVALRRFRLGRTLWNLLVHHSCSQMLTALAGSEAEAARSAIEFVDRNLPGPQTRVRCRARERGGDSKVKAANESI